MENNEQASVEALLERAATSGTGIPEFLTALLDATVIVPGTTSPAPDGGQTATFPPLVKADGTQAQPFYTSADRLSETLTAIPGFESHYIALPCRDLWQMTRGATLVLNPHSPYGKEFLPGEIAQLLDGNATLTPQVVAKDTEVMVGSPAQVPDGMEDDLSRLFAAHPSVERAFLGWKVVPETGDQSYLLVIVGPSTVRDELSDELGRALVLFSQVHPVDVQFAAPREKHLLTSLSPFYSGPHRKRSLFGR